MSLPAQEKATKSNLTVKEWNIDAGTNQKVLDHLTIYNASGRKVEEAEYDRKGQKWRKKYEYAPRRQPDQNAGLRLLEQARQHPQVRIQ